MQYGFFGKPIGVLAGARPFVIGPGFATYPAAGATISKGFGKAVPVTTAATKAFGKPFAKGFAKPFGKGFGKI